MLLKKIYELFFLRFLPMMYLLMVDIGDGIMYIRNTHTEGLIPLLPHKICLLSFRVPTSHRVSLTTLPRNELLELRYESVYPGMNSWASLTGRPISFKCG